MRQMLGAVVVGMAVVTAAHGHALYLVPDAANATQVIVVFGHDLEPDPAVKATTWQRFESLKLSARDDAGQTKPVTFTQKTDHFQATVPTGTRVVFGDVETGLSVKGDAAPKLVRHSPKAILGPIPADGGRLGDTVMLDIVPKTEAGKVRFQVLSRGKPVAAATVHVLVPEMAEEVEATTDDQGWTRAFDAVGRYGVTCRRVEPATGERDGKKYDGISHTATLVVNVK